MGEKKIVLAVDDNPQQLQNYKLLLGQRYDLRLIDSAPNALGFLLKSKADVILLDIEMPEIDGFEFLGDIQKILSDKYSHVIIVSGNSNEAFIKQARQSSAFDVLTKPVSQDVLIGAIERALSENGKT